MINKANGMLLLKMWFILNNTAATATIYHDKKWNYNQTQSIEELYWKVLLVELGPRLPKSKCWSPNPQYLECDYIRYRDFKEIIKFKWDH